jgi:LmbE family N-acetylglucosaminyl deacetylase
VTTDAEGVVAGTASRGVAELSRTSERPLGSDGPSASGLGTTAPKEWGLTGRDMATFPLMKGRVVVVSAHPDDETLATGGLLQSLHRGGARLEIVIATDGEAAFPLLDQDTRRELGRSRRAEMTEALVRLGLANTPVTWLGLPDSGLSAAELAEALTPIVSGADMCLAPWPDDPHPDHQAAGSAARVAAGAGTEVWGYPIWTWPWKDPRTTAMPWALAARHWLDAEERQRKHAAIAAFVSQLTPGPLGEAPILVPETCAHFEIPVEVLFRVPPTASTPLARFASLYRANTDPWGTATREYELRKREVTMACLPRSRYRRALDVGCGTGLLTAQLAARCDEVVAVDAVAAAVRSARSVTSQHRNVRVEIARIPEEVPSGPFDLVVFSEVLYYLDRADLAATLANVERQIGPGADILAVDWRPQTHDAPRDAESAHEQLLSHAGWRVLVWHAEAEFLLHVLRRA